MLENDLKLLIDYQNSLIDESLQLKLSFWLFFFFIDMLVKLIAIPIKHFALSIQDNIQYILIICRILPGTNRVVLV